MVAKITFPDSLADALNYHEQKLQKGSAECLYANNFLLDAGDMNFYDKRDRLQNQMDLNTRAQKKLMHISLNFDPSESFSQQELKNIACSYMEKIGFSDQPYLVYEHTDAGHPHIHILTSLIQDNGVRINTHFIGQNQSSKAREEIELEYDLVRAAGRRTGQQQDIEPVDPAVVLYGKSETKRSIVNVLDNVLDQYKYSSLAELNAILRQFNVIADGGKQGSRLFNSLGLVYRILDENGSKVGVPIKASSIYNKPTLATLELKFLQNEKKPHSKAGDLKEIIQQALTRSQSFSDFIKELERRNVSTALHRSDSGFLYGITFVDHNTKYVFKGSDLGKEFSAAAIQQKFASMTGASITETSHDLASKTDSQMNIEHGPEITARRKSSKIPKDKTRARANQLLEQLLRPAKGESQIPDDLLRKKRKKKKRKLGL